MKQKLMKCMISLFMCSVFVVTMLMAKMSSNAVVVNAATGVDVTDKLTVTNVSMYDNSHNYIIEDNVVTAAELVHRSYYFMDISWEINEAISDGDYLTLFILKNNL